MTAFRAMSFRSIYVCFETQAPQFTVISLTFLLVSGDVFSLPVLLSLVFHLVSCSALWSAFCSSLDLHFHGLKHLHQLVFPLNGLAVSLCGDKYPFIPDIIVTTGGLLRR